MNKILTVCVLVSMLIFIACSPIEQSAVALDTPVEIYPDYTDVTVPYNIAPLRFQITDNFLSHNKFNEIQAVFVSGATKYVISARGAEIAISEKAWRSLLAASDLIKVKIQCKSDKWVEYQPFHIHISPDRIDPYLAYRLIEPGYEVWNKMGIYQRDLESFDESPILENSSTNYGCMNCHSFNQYDADQMLFHLRSDYSGTYFVVNGNVEKLDTKLPETISAFVYPYWHPSGKFVAFSTNITKQMFHSTNHNRIEVFDSASDIVVYDVEKHSVTSCPQLKSSAAFETFPAFSPDGKTLYFCSADSVKMPENYDNVRYSLFSIPFNPDNCTFGSAVDTLFNAKTAQKSVSFPRVSPNGRWLMFTLSDYGNFSIWHQEADLYLLDLQNNEVHESTAINSNSVESYHSWSSNGRWIVFSSRREDGLYTQPYFSHFDDEGNFTKPFVLPQKDSEYYHRKMKSYNIPEFVSSKVETSGSGLSNAVKNSTAITLKNNR